MWGTGTGDRLEVATRFEGCSPPPRYRSWRRCCQGRGVGPLLWHGLAPAWAKSGWLLVASPRPSQALSRCPSPPRQGTEPSSAMQAAAGGFPEVSWTRTLQLPPWSWRSMQGVGQRSRRRASRVGSCESVAACAPRRRLRRQDLAHGSLKGLCAVGCRSHRTHHRTVQGAHCKAAARQLCSTSASTARRACASRQLQEHRPAARRP